MGYEKAYTSYVQYSWAYEPYSVNTMVEAFDLAHTMVSLRPCHLFSFHDKCPKPRTLNLFAFSYAVLFSLVTPWPIRDESAWRISSWAVPPDVLMSL